MCSFWWEPPSFSLEKRCKEKGWLLFCFFSQASFSFPAAAVLTADLVTRAHAAWQYLSQCKLLWPVKVTSCSIPLWRLFERLKQGCLLINNGYGTDRIKQIRAVSGEITGQFQAPSHRANLTSNRKQPATMDSNCEAVEGTNSVTQWMPVILDSTQYGSLYWD